MIGNLTKMSSPAVLVRYLFRSKEHPGESRGCLLGGTVVVGNESDLIGHFEWLGRLRPDVSSGDWIYHLSISFPPGEYADPDRKLEVARYVCAAMKWPSWVAVEHLHKTDHLHVMAARISPSGVVSRDLLRSYRVIERALRSLEIKYGYTRVPSPARPRNIHGRLPRPTRITNRERQMAREGKQAEKQRLRDAIDEVIAAGFKKGAVLIEMKRRGYEPHTTWRSGHPIGICWQHIESGHRFPGGRLGTEYSGKRFFERIGGFHGEISDGSTLGNIRIVPYDTKKRWAVILRNLGYGNRPMAYPLVRQ